MEGWFFRRSCTLPKFHLVLLIHAHQPIGNFDGVFEQVYQRSYLPFLEHVARHPSIRLGLHYSGPLLEWCERRHPEYLDLLRELVARRQVELVGGGFYEPILVSIPRADQAEQLGRMREYLLRNFGAAPAGAWLAERVWEPQLPNVLSEAGVQYTIVDDVHFLAAGFEMDQLHGDYVAEDGGRTVRVLPGLKSLRYLLPFRSPEEGLAFLRESAGRNPGGMAAMGDDCEKFGAWPSTYDHCYRDGWVERFFAALESSSDWLLTTPPGEYVATHAPLGRADLPTASYSEMMEWVLPTAARSAFHERSQEFEGRPDVLRFLRGGHWRGFLSKYSESNLLNKKMIHVSGQLRGLESRRFGGRKRAKLACARTHLLRAQCNDAYWHGVFGGLYAPHLRTEPWRELVRAETLAHAIAAPDANGLHVERLDYDADAAEEIYVTSRRLAALIRPADGGTIAALDFRTSGVTLINSMQRRVEAYHSRLREASAGGSAPVRVASIHDQVRVKEERLERFLQYDRWPRNAFRLLLFPGGKTFEDYQLLKMDENAALAGGAFTFRETHPMGVTLACEAPGADAASHAAASGAISCVKKYSFVHDEDGYRVECEIELRAQQPLPSMVGVEMVLNFLAPDEPDRYFEVADGRHSLRWAAAVSASELPAARLRIVDEWQNVAATLEAPNAAQFWVAPIETVSESEEGFERVYLGSQILAVWPHALAGVPWRGNLSLHIAPARAGADNALA
jgi:hypothetical protein